jgi:hypothetical protein
MDRIRYIASRKRYGPKGLGASSAHPSTGFGVYGSSGYYPRPYYDSFWESIFPPYDSLYQYLGKILDSRA